MIFNAIEGRRLMSYLKNNHHEKWSELTYVPGFGPGGRNSIRTLRWQYSPDDLGDPRLATLKRQHRDFIRWSLTVLISYLVLISVLVVLTTSPNSRKKKTRQATSTFMPPNETPVHQGRFEPTATLIQRPSARLSATAQLL